MSKRKASDFERAIAAAMADSALDLAGPGSILLVSTPGDLSANLKSYGEPAAAERALAATQPELRRIYERAAEIVGSVANDHKALALAAVEVFEGRPRALARKRCLPVADR
jgi:hypothetical protein